MHGLNSTCCSVCYRSCHPMALCPNLETSSQLPAPSSQESSSGKTATSLSLKMKRGAKHTRKAASKPKETKEPKDTENWGHVRLLPGRA